ncbi:MAG: DUF2339 domain-containing protein [Gammaproteobacteria bacterium PRO9]|nr:DUF2339 domain-containing protein [Gammaproteobacteria bacterium PRO9]
MITLIFFAALAAIIGIVLAIEGDGEQAVRLNRPIGLITWLTSGNWPAKVGGALVIVGVGALLRYALINVDVPSELKLIGGLVIALALGFGSMLAGKEGTRRAVSLALGGAAFGVAYLTAYSAFGLFGFIPNTTGLALLGLTSVGAAVFAVTRSALSLAVLSMVGAYLAPAFAVSDPGPAVVYGYYVGASLLTLAMVMARGWRPLIHLSFLFTLAGGVFFGWTAQYYTAPHVDVMVAILLLLSAIHVAMPIAERSNTRTHWLEQLDLVYMIALPTVAAILAVAISPSRVELATVLVLLGAIWTLAAVGLQLTRRAGAAAHAVIATVLIGLGVAARFRDLPWELISLAFSVGALAAAAWRTPLSRLHSTLAGLVVLFGAIHVLSSLASVAEGPAFLNGVFLERIVGAALLITAGAICRRIRQTLDTLLLAVGILWALIAIGGELIRLDLAALPLILHWALLLVAASLWVPGRRVLVADSAIKALAVLIVATAAWSSASTGINPSWITLVLAPMVLLGIAVRPQYVANDSSEERLAAALLAPVVAAIWGGHVGSLLEYDVIPFALNCAATVGLVTLVAGRMARDHRGEWLENAVDLFGAAFAAVLAGCTLLYISRSPWAISLEVLTLVGLVGVTWIRHSQQRPTDLSVAACIVGLALLLQANLMRLLSSAESLSVLDVLTLRWPAVVSLLWAGLGGALTVWSRRVASRTLWVTGATLLVGAAVKVLLLDFGSLGQLANILAVIAAGGVFLLVGWLAPMPPKGTKQSRVSGSENRDHGQRRSAWTFGALAAIVAFLFVYRNDAGEMMRLTQESVPLEPTAAIAATPDPPEARAESSSDDENGDGTTQDSVQSEPIDLGVDADTGDPSGLAADEPERATAPVADAWRAEEAAAEVTQPTQPTRWVPPPTVDANGVRTYTQYSYPQVNEAAVPRPGPQPGVVRMPPPPLASQEAGIDQLVRQGVLRRATPRDVDAWIAATGSKDRESLHLDILDPFTGNRYVMRTYVVTREMTFPEGLYGAHSATFIVPRNVPRPYGDPGHSTILEMRR